MKSIKFETQENKNYMTQSGGGTNDGGYIWVG